MKQQPLANWQQNVVCESNSVALFLAVVCVFDGGGRATSSCEAITHAISYSEISQCFDDQGDSKGFNSKKQGSHACQKRKEKQ